MASYQKKNLTLDRITGIRPDRGQKMTYVPVIKEKKLPSVNKSQKNSPNVKQNKWKF